MDVSRIRDALNTTAGHELLKYLNMKVDELRDIQSVANVGNDKRQLVEFIACRLAHGKLFEIVKALKVLRVEKQIKDPRDSFNVE